MFNIFRIIADACHVASKCILIWAIHSNRSAEGVSLNTQVLYILVFCTRYLDLFWTHPGAWRESYNFIFKIFYIVSSFYIVFLMTRVFSRTRERGKAWRFGIYSLAGSAVLTPFTYLIFNRAPFRFSEILWVFSIILESVCVLPQLLLLRQTTVPTVINSFYLVTLGSYRGFYILNWILRAATEGYFDPIAAIFGIIQTAFYVDFAWVYWTRQRVKLRGGGIIDSEDFSRGLLLSRFVGRTSDGDDEEGRPGLDDQDPAGPPGAPAGRGWGVRGISVSADEGVYDVHKKTGADPGEVPLADPDSFEDSEDRDHKDPPAS